MNTGKLMTGAVVLALLAATATGGAWAAEGRGDRADRAERQDNRRDGRPEGRPDNRHDNRRDGRPDGRPDNRHDGRWFDGAYGHNHRYPAPGRVVVLPPRPPAPVWWGGVGYRYWDGVWATSGPRGWVTVRPPLGIWVTDLPSWRTALVIGGVAYFYANGVYYRDRSGGGYEVVPAPVAAPDAPPPDRHFVYPRQGQGPQQQASDEYECHRWAVTQSGFDPTGAATGQVTVTTSNPSTNSRGEYLRAQAACLDGRGYTVR